MIVVWLKMKVFSILLLFICALLGYLLFTDEQLDDGIADLIQQYNNEHLVENNGSIFQLGMWSEISEDPMQIGLWRLSQYQNALKKMADGSQELDYQDYPEELLINNLYTIENIPNLLCDLKDPNCLEYIYLNSELIADIVTPKILYIERYDQQMTFKDFSLYEKPSYYLPVPSFGPSETILQLKLLQLIEEFKAEQYQSTIQALTQLVNFHKRILAQTPYMVPKIKSLVELEMVLNTTAFLVSKTPQPQLNLWQPTLAAFAPLTKAQLSMDKQFFHEFVAQVNALEDINLDDYNLNEYDESLPKFLNLLPTKVLYKKNKTINMLYQWMTSNQGLMSLENNHITTKAKSKMEDILTFDYQNPMGSMLAISMAPKLLNLEPFLYQLNVKQQMLNYLFLAKIKAEQLTPFLSPFTQDPAYFSEQLFCITTNKNSESDICISQL